MNTTHGRQGATRRGTRLIAMSAILATLLTGAIAGVAPAFAADYPTWEDVSWARNNEAATAAAITEIKGLLDGLEAEAARTRADAELKGNLWQEADNKFQAAAARTATLQEQADAASAKADDSELRAGQMAAQLVRSGSGDLTANLLMNSDDAANLLYGLGMSSKISEQANAIYERALLDRNTAQALTDQATVARNELETLKAAAEVAFGEAQSAASAAEAALQEQVTRKAELDQQIVFLTAARVATETEYLAGVQERLAAQAWAEANARAAQPSLAAGEISLSGWVRPAGGYITSVYGYSSSYGSNFHKGTDLGAGCGANIYAASTGTVEYASEGWNGGYGNYIIINHGGGVSTAYGHIRPGGILVSAGESVGVGQNIAYVGTTGNSTGCHLHFEVRINGGTVNPQGFMSDQGVRLG